MTHEAELTALLEAIVRTKPQSSHRRSLLKSLLENVVMLAEQDPDTLDLKIAETALAELVEAFEATLQEAAEADLLLHVVDAASPNRDEQMDEVQRVLESIGASQIPQLLVFNKIDRLESDQMPRVDVDSIALADGRSLQRVFISAAKGLGIDRLRQLITDASAADVADVSSPRHTSLPDPAPTADDEIAQTIPASNGFYSLTA